VSVGSSFRRACDGRSERAHEGTQLGLLRHHSWPPADECELLHSLLLATSLPLARSTPAHGWSPPPSSAPSSSTERVPRRLSMWCSVRKGRGTNQGQSTAAADPSDTRSQQTLTPGFCFCSRHSHFAFTFFCYSDHTVASALTDNDVHTSGSLSMMSERRATGRRRCGGCCGGGSLNREPEEV
jgi:hypothetical protein